MTRQDAAKLLQFFLASAKRDYDNFTYLKKGRRYDAALFFLHLTIEKKIKALLIKQTKAHPPTTHDLVFLIARTGLIPSTEWLDWLRTISTFNIATRYEDEKFAFYQAATASFVKIWQQRAEVIIQWIDEALRKT